MDTGYKNMDTSHTHFEIDTSNMDVKQNSCSIWRSLAIALFTAVVTAIVCIASFYQFAPTADVCFVERPIGWERSATPKQDLELKDQLSSAIQAFVNLEAEDHSTPVNVSKPNRRELGNHVVRIDIENELSTPIAVDIKCNQKLVSKTVKEWNVYVEGQGGKGGATAGGKIGFGSKSTTEYVTRFAQTKGLSLVAANSQHSETPECADRVAYITVIRPDGLNYLNNAIENGRMILVQDKRNKVVESKRCHGDGVNCGCHKNYCWSYCSFGHQWCYTTRGSSQDYGYIHCDDEEVCRSDWACAGSCTV